MGLHRSRYISARETYDRRFKKPVYRLHVTSNSKCCCEDALEHRFRLVLFRKAEAVAATSSNHVHDSLIQPRLCVPESRGPKTPACVHARVKGGVLDADPSNSILTNLEDFCAPEDKNRSKLDVCHASPATCELRAVTDFSSLLLLLL